MFDCRLKDVWRTVGVLQQPLQIIAELQRGRNGELRALHKLTSNSNNCIKSFLMTREAEALELHRNISKQQPHKITDKEQTSVVAREASMYHALIRTHHITSRRKVSVLKAAAKQLQCYALLRSGGVPGVMYVQGSEESNVRSWVETVHDLRYKDYQLAATPTAMIRASWLGKVGTLEEADTVKAMGQRFDEVGLTEWWRLSMGFVKDD